MLKKAIKILKKNGYEIENENDVIKGYDNYVRVKIYDEYDKSIKENILKLLSNHKIYIDYTMEKTLFWENSLKTIDLGMY